MSEQLVPYAKLIEVVDGFTAAVNRLAAALEPKSGGGGPSVPIVIHQCHCQCPPRHWGGGYWGPGGGGGGGSGGSGGG